MILEGSGLLHPERWQAAVAQASEACPGSRVRLRGWLSRARWVDTGETPPVRVIDGSSWAGTSPAGAPFLNEGLDTCGGPTCEVLLVEGTPKRVVVRTHHGVMDGRGTVLWAEEIFRCLRGETPIGALDTRNDLDIALARVSPAAGRRQEDCISPVGSTWTDERGVVWQRRTLQGRFSKLLPRVAAVVAAQAREQGEGRVRVDVPVDLRPYAPESVSTANLTGMVHLEIEPGHAVAEITATLRDARGALLDASFVRSFSGLRFVPMWLMRWAGRQGARGVRKTGRTICSAVLSNLGRFRREPLSGGGFRTDSVFFVPPATDTLPLFVTLSGLGSSVEIAASIPKALGGEGALSGLLDRIAADLQGCSGRED